MTIFFLSFSIINFTPAISSNWSKYTEFYQSQPVGYSSVHTRTRNLKKNHISVLKCRTRGLNSWITPVTSVLCCAVPAIPNRFGFLNESISFVFQQAQLYSEKNEVEWIRLTWPKGQFWKVKFRDIAKDNLENLWNNNLKPDNLVRSVLMWKVSEQSNSSRKRI